MLKSRSAPGNDAHKPKAQRSAELAQRLPQICAAITGGIAVLALIGWLVNVRLLAGQWGTYVPMAPSSALAFLLLGGALFIYARGPNQRSSRILVLAAVSIVSLLGLLALVQFIAGIDFGIEQVLSGTTELLGNIPLGRMAPLTALSFLLEGVAILISLSAQRWRHVATTAALFAAGATAINFIVLVGYAFGAPVLYGGQTVPSSFPSAAAFVAAGIGLLQMTLSRSPRFHLWSRNSLRGRLLRAFAPFLIGFILIQDWLQLKLESVVDINPALYTALSTIVGVILIAFLIAWIALHTGEAEEQSQAQIISLVRFLDEDPNPVLRFTRDGRLIYANRNSQSLLEYWHSETTDESLPEAERHWIAETLVRGVSQQTEVTCGGITYSLLLVPIMEMGYVNIYGRDITERKQAEEALRESQSLYHSLVEVSPLSICRKDLAGRFTFANRRFLEESHITLAELVGKTDFDVHPPELAEKYRRDDRAVMDGGQVQEIIEERAMLGGEAITTQSIKAPIYDGTGQINGVQIAFWDITARQRAESQREAALEALRELNVTLEQRVADRTLELAAANTRLTELDRLKDEFVARISHELYTPLVNIKLYLGLLDRGKPEKHAEYMDTLRREAARLQQLIENLLHISQLDLEADDIQIAPIDVNQLLTQLVIDQSGLARERNLRIESQPASDLPRAAADSTWLLQALSNLMTNAMNYTPSGGMIMLSTALQPGDDRAWVTCTIRDTGPGISAKDRPHIFERFYRGEAAKDYTIPGTGLGLAISKEIIEKMGGRITVEGEPGHGAAFTVWLQQG